MRAVRSVGWATALSVFGILAIVASVAIVLGTASPLAAQATREGDSALERLDTWGKGRGWEAVGVLDLENDANCTGTLIRPDLVLTAAHCLFNDANRLRDPRRIAFHAGWRNGASVSYRRARAAIVHPGYDPTSERNSARLRYDLALVQLESPIVSTHAEPLLPGGAPLRQGSQVSVVSYGAARMDAPSRQRACSVLDVFRGMVALSCEAEPGSSGSPIFTLQDDRPRIVAVVSAIGEMQGRRVSYAMDIAAPLSDLLRDLAAGRGVFPEAAVQARRLAVDNDGSVASGDGGRGNTGAKFVRP